MSNYNTRVIGEDCDISQLTAIVATHERKDSLDQLLKTFGGFYPDLQIIVADSSYNFEKKHTITHIAMDPGSGISSQRNRALREVSTPLFLLLDDDYECSIDTDLRFFLRRYLDSKADILGGGYRNIGSDDFDFHGTYKILDQTLYHFVGNGHISNGLVFCDVTHNYFIGNTNQVKKLGGWDNNLKFAREHDDFFLKMSSNDVTVAYANDVVVNHRIAPKYHGGTKSLPCVQHFCEKWGVQNKIEIRCIHRDGEKPYISIHSCMSTEQPVIHKYVADQITAIYGDFTYKITTNESAA